MCVRLYSKFKMLTTELLLNKQWARHFLPFEYLVICAGVRVMKFWYAKKHEMHFHVWWIVVPNSTQDTRHKTHCMITKTFLLHDAWNGLKTFWSIDAFPPKYIFIIMIIIIINEMSFKLQALNLHHAFYTEHWTPQWKFITINSFSCCMHDVISWWNFIKLSSVYSLFPIFSAHSYTQFELHMQWIFNFRSEELICGPSQIVKLQIREWNLSEQWTVCCLLGWWNEQANEQVIEGNRPKCW